MDELEQFYKFPKHWLTEEPFCNIDLRALCLLMKLKDLSELAELYEQTEDGFPFVNFTLDQIADFTRTSRPTAKKFKDLLIKNGLIFTKKRGQKNSDKIFIDVKKLYKDSKVSLPREERNFTNNPNESVKNLSEVSKNSFESQSNSFQKSVKNLYPYNNYTRPNNKTYLQDYQSNLKNINNLTDAYQSTFGFGRLNEISLSMLLEEVEAYGEDLVIYALEKSREQRARRFSYTQKILSNWRNEGLHTVEAVKANESKPPKSSGSNNYYGIEGSGY